MAAEIEQVSVSDPVAVAPGAPPAGLARRLLDWRTALSFGIAVAILVLAFGKAGIR